MGKTDKPSDTLLPVSLDTSARFFFLFILFPFLIYITNDYYIINYTRNRNKNNTETKPMV